MDHKALRDRESDPRPVTIVCRDGLCLGGHIWETSGIRKVGRVIINPATGVLARFYHRYARFLAGRGFSVLTYDYRGIGQSRPQIMRGCGFRWRDWAEFDFDAAFRFMEGHGDSPLLVVGHSIGGFLPGLAESGVRVERMLTVGAQFAWWGDYARSKRLKLFLKWHTVMPLATLVCGYFPGRRLGWLEDLPAGVANEWSFRGRRFERSFPSHERKPSLARMETFSAPILAVTMSDDELGTVAAARRTLRYYSGADRTLVLLQPSDYGREEVGHFDLFHDAHASGFWLDTLLWLRDGRNPWPHRRIGLGGQSEREPPRPVKPLIPGQP